MKRIVLTFAALAVLTIAGTASAADNTATLMVTGTVESSISITIETTDAIASGAGTAAASSTLGNISKFGTAPTGFTLARGATDWTLSATVGVQVIKANLTSDDYNLTAQLASPSAGGVDWKMNGFTLNDSAPTSLDSGVSYDSTHNYPWDIVIADSADPAAINNSIIFTASSN